MHSTIGSRSCCADRLVGDPRSRDALPRLCQERVRLWPHRPSPRELYASGSASDEGVAAGHRLVLAGGEGGGEAADALVDAGGRDVREAEPQPVAAEATPQSAVALAWRHGSAASSSSSAA